MRTVEELIHTFWSIWNGEHGSHQLEDHDIIDPLLNRAFEYEGEITNDELLELIAGRENEDGDVLVPEELERKFPLLNIVCQFRIEFTDIELTEKFEKIWNLDS